MRWGSACWCFPKSRKAENSTSFPISSASLSLSLSNFVLSPRQNTFFCVCLQPERVKLPAMSPYLNINLLNINSFKSLLKSWTATGRRVLRVNSQSLLILGSRVSIHFSSIRFNKSLLIPARAIARNCSVLGGKKEARTEEGTITATKKLKDQIM